MKSKGMKRNSRRVSIIAALCMLLGAASTASAQKTGPRATLKKLTAELQSSPDNRELREKIIKLALKLKPAPAVPKEARKSFIKGVTFQTEGKAEGDFFLAVKAFQNAANVAPWWADAYHNLSVSLEAVQRYEEAMTALNLHLMCRPPDPKAAEERLAVLEARMELAAQRAATEAAEAAAEVVEKNRVALSGVWTYPEAGGILKFKKVGQDEFTMYDFGEKQFTIRFDGRDFKGELFPRTGFKYRGELKGRINETNDRIVWQERFFNLPARWQVAAGWTERIIIRKE